MTTDNTSHNNAAQDNAAQTSSAASQPRVEVMKGNISGAQRAALEQIVDDVAAAVERENSLKPDTRGHFGTPTRPRADNTANPTGFRSNPLPRR